MLTVDLHSHTFYSHAKDSAADMHAAALARGLTVFGFSEHSPRPEGYDYDPRYEYRERLAAHLQDYADEVAALKALGGPCRVLFGMEIDWFEDEEDFVRRACALYPYDYLIGSTHFLGHWGFDGDPARWQLMGESERRAAYEAYFRTWKKMLATGLFNIAAHPDLVKLFTMDSFHAWLAREESQRLVREALEVLKARGMAMEISSAGLRKPCREIYPCPLIMRLASELGLHVSFASDSHNVQDVGHAFPVLASYAQAFGFTTCSWFEGGVRHELAF